MNPRSRSLACFHGCLLLAGLSGSAVAADAEAEGKYSVTAHWKIGGTGGWDLLAVDEGSRRLFLSRSDRVVVLDADNGKVVGEVAHTDGVHGIAVAPDLGRGYTSNGRADSVTVFDLKTFKPIGEIKIDGQNPDVIVYDRNRHRLYTFNGRSANASVIDARTLAQVGTIALGGKPEFAVSDGRGRMYVNIEDKAELSVIDEKALKVVATWRLESCEEPTGLALDAEHHRLFSVCQNGQMIVTDSSDGHRVASVPIGHGPDGAAFDASRGLVFSSNGADGTLTIVHEDDPQHFRVVDNLVTQKSARTLALDAKTHRLFLPAAEFGATPPPTPERPHPRPAMLPDTFTVLVVGS
ncbi:MAG TPA: YncE family protein [Rudaea sp.]|nr:YncE family protein [Rudaea sp.]